MHISELRFGESKWLPIGHQLWKKLSSVPRSLYHQEFLETLRGGDSSKSNSDFLGFLGVIGLDLERTCISGIFDGSNSDFDPRDICSGEPLSSKVAMLPQIASGSRNAWMCIIHRIH
jgi:hypothetical protein